MFVGSFGLIPGAVCTDTAALSSKVELKIAVDTCLKLSPKGDCPNGQHGPIAEWDVSSVTDMSKFTLRPYFLFCLGVPSPDSPHGHLCYFVVRSCTLSATSVFLPSLQRLHVWCECYCFPVPGWSLSLSPFIFLGQFRYYRWSYRARGPYMWDESSVADMSRMFSNAKDFDDKISRWVGQA